MINKSLSMNKTRILSDIALTRLKSQHIGGTEFTSPKAIVSWMCAMQAQDFPMAEWAIGVRLPGSQVSLIEAAINNGEILRTHLLRPTWHFVASEDIHWLLELSAPQIKASQRARDRDLELTVAVYNKSNATIEKALSSRGHLTREELMVELETVGIATDQNRASHLLMRAELEKIICSGAILRGKPTYALLAERVLKTKVLTKEEALAELARRYFTSRSPATLQDFSWWSGLPARDAGHALDLIKSKFYPEHINSRTYWLAPDLALPQASQHQVHLLPTYDECILSYSDRGASIPSALESHMKEISDRGVFRPIIVVNGQVTGIWKRTIKKDGILVEIQPFLEPNPSVLALFERAAAKFAAFWNKKLNFIPLSSTF